MTEVRAHEESCNLAELMLSICRANCRGYFPSDIVWGLAETLQKSGKSYFSGILTKLCWKMATLLLCSAPWRPGLHWNVYWELPELHDGSYQLTRRRLHFDNPDQIVVASENFKDSAQFPLHGPLVIFCKQN